MNISEIFASNMRQKRISLGLTQKQLAQSLGYSEKSVSKWESGKTIPPGVLLPQISEILQIRIDDLFDSGEKPAYFLGIDGGGTKTDFMLADKNGTIIKHTALGESNPVDIGLNKTFEVLEMGISEVCNGVFHNKVSVFAGIAGGITGDNKEKINAFLGKFRFGRYDNGSDAQNAVSASLNEKDGITVILGTGDIAFTKKGVNCYRTGGFGYLFDAGGSGYSIGRDALLFALNAEQMGEKDSILSVMLKEYGGKETLLKALSDFYDGGKRKIASVAPLVFSAYEKGDAAAQNIIDQNFKAVAQLILDASRFLNHKDITVSLVGSITKSRIVIPTIQKYINRMDTDKRFHISLCHTPPVIGALRLAGLKESVKSD